jgi:hypothetical protein
VRLIPDSSLNPAVSETAATVAETWTVTMG